MKRTTILHFFPHPLADHVAMFQGCQQARYYGASILKYPPLGKRYEVRTEDDEILHFDTDEELHQWMMNPNHEGE